MERREVPKSWLIVKLGDVLYDIVGGGTPSKSVPEYFQGSIPLMTVKDMKNSRPVETGFNITEEALADSSSKVVPADTVIIATRMGLGKVVRPKMATAINQDLKALFPSGALDKSFLENWLISVASKIEAMGTGTTVKGVRLNEIRELQIPLAPLNEQRRIVEKIETLFARLDKGEEALRDVQKLLARYRQSVLKAAVTGQLTADWRAENAHRLEPGQDLLARILQARRETWDGRGKYKEPVAPDTTDLPELPEGWVWASLGALISKGPRNGLYLPQSKYGSGTPILRIDDYQVDWLRPVQELRRVAAEPEECDKYGLRHGDFVVNRVNSVSHLGKTTLLPAEYDGALFESNMMRFSVSGQVSSEYLHLYLTSELGRKRLTKNCKHAVNQASINQGDVEATPVPLPPRLEQEQIAQIVAEESSREIASLKTCQTELARSAALRQSILKDAFAGRLVPQDPADEPAAALLARIRQTRAAAPGKTGRKTRA